MSTQPLSTPVRILHLGSDPARPPQIAEALAAAGIAADFERVDSLEALRHALGRDRRVALVLSEIAPPAPDAVEALRLARQAGIPFVFLTNGDAPIADEGLGATDVVPASALPAVARAVRRALREAECQQRLRAVEEQLRDADRQRTQFLAVLSHELRNPLAPLRNSLYVLAHAEPGGDAARRAQQVIERQVAQLAQLIDDLLDVTRVPRGKIRLSMEQVDLAALARRVGEEQRAEFDRLGVSFRVAAREPLFVSGDAGRLAQVVEKLLHNAAKFTPRDGNAALVVERGGPGRVRLVVRDDGAGIAPHMLTRVFEPFVQSEPTLDSSRAGMGLGLALVKGLVELHGGQVAAHSPGLGRGSELVVELPEAAPASDLPT